MMALILVLDCETTGLVLEDRPLSDPAQPRIVQLACLLLDDDQELASMSVIVARDGRPIPAEAAAVHGIDDALADRCGVALAAALGMFLRLARLAELLVAHNALFDLQAVRAGFYQLGAPAVAQEIATMPSACTMEMAGPVVNLPPTEKMVAAGFMWPKSPSLAECVRHFFAEDLVGAHDALVDVRACARVYRHLVGMKAAMSQVTP